MSHSFPCSILLVSADGDPVGLLAERAVETDPVVIAPTCYRVSERQWVAYDPRVRPPYGSMHVFALALAWDAKVLPDGVSRGINAGLPSRWRSMWVRFSANENRSFSSSYGWRQALVDSDVVLTDDMKDALYAVDPMRVPNDLRSTWLLANVLMVLHGGSVVVLDRDRKEMR